MERAAASPEPIPGHACVRFGRLVAVARGTPLQKRRLRRISWRMERIAAALLALGVAACSSGAVAEGTNQPVLARFPPNRGSDILQVTVSDGQPVRTAELVGPAETVPAYSINNE